ncbi:hypothetical protein QQX98_013146 [Neonectria punicea]|uniref:Myb/SANT-like domain-containing protein n=1 Tax=Neonectria punicea TaxID=979145 RepID=A0ABR1GH43_9HYPO
MSTADLEVTDLPHEPSGSPAPEPCPTIEGSDLGPTARSPVVSPSAMDSLTVNLAGPVSAADPEVTASSAEPLLSPKPVSRVLTAPAADDANDMPPPARAVQSAQSQDPSPLRAASKRKRNTQRTPSRLFWRPDMTLLFLERLQEAAAEGKLNSMKVVYLKPVLADILIVMKTQWPNEPLTVPKLMTHFKNLRLKHKQFLCIAYKSGVTFDHDTGLVSASDELWDAYDRQHGASGAWLRSVGLPQPEIYSFVFDGNRAGGATAIEAGDVAGINRIDLTTAGAEGGETFGDEDDEDISESLDMQESVISTSDSSVVTPLGRSAPSPSPSIVSARARRARRVKSSHQDADSDTMTGSIGALAASISEYTTVMREVGSQQVRGFGPDLDMAISDGKELFGLKGIQLVRFMQGLSASAAVPVL